MTTTVILDGVMGKKFGKKWDLHINSPAQAIRLINANRPGFLHWIRDNLTQYESYEVVCEYKNGNIEAIGEEELIMNGDIKSIRFTPILTGTGNTLKIIGGVALVVIGLYTHNSQLVMLGAGLALSGIAGALTSQPTLGLSDTQLRVDKTSYYFNGPSNTTMQGVPVSLIYGRCLVGSHPISVSLTVDEATV